MCAQARAAAAEAAEAAEARIVSRYCVAREVEALARVLAGMRPRDRQLIEEVLVDSKATWMVRVTLRRWCAADAERVAGLVEAGMLAEVGGHNGIVVIGRGDRVFVPACWAVSAANGGG